MLYFFTWNSDFLLKEYVKSWKDLFIKKHWEFNLIYIKDLSNIKESNLTESILSWWFLSEKKLIIIEWLPTVSAEKSPDIINLQNKFLSLIDNIPEDNIVVFSTINPDKRTKFYKKLIKIANIKDFSIKNESDLIRFIENRFNWRIDRQAINTIIKYKSWNLNKIINELEKLFILNEKVDNDIIIKEIEPELEENIFMFINDILNKDIKKALFKLDLILQTSNIYAFYNWFLANIRNQIYIFKLKDLSITKSDIIQLLKLWNKGFLVDKKYKISFKELKKLFISLINLDKKMKTWNLLWTKDIDFRFELEKILLNINF